MPAANVDPIPRTARLTASAVLLSLCLAAGAMSYSGKAAPTLLIAPALRINLNTADAATLELLPRIGPALARKIIDDRAAKGPFKHLEDLDRVPGIGPRTIELLRDHVTVTTTDPPATQSPTP
jgi:competence ComEA-like helix-hairpin-helix protein